MLTNSGDSGHPSLFLDLEKILEVFPNLESDWFLGIRYTYIYIHIYICIYIYIFFFFYHVKKESIKYSFLFFFRLFWGFVCLFIYFWLRWVCCCVRAFSSCCERGLLFIVVRKVLFVVHELLASCCGARALGAWASVVVARGLSSCGSWALGRRPRRCGARA